MLLTSLFSKSLLCSLFSLALLVTSVSASAQIPFDIELVADADGKWVDFFSDAFGQIDGGPSYPGGAGLSDGFYQFSSLPSYFTLGGGTSVFPLGANFGDVGEIYLDSSGGIPASGTVLVPIVDVDIDFTQFIADNDNVINAPYTSEFSSVSGTATVVDGDVISVTLTSTVVFTYDATLFGLGLVSFTGAFDITNNVWDLFCDCPEVYSAGGGNIGYRWDFSGLATPVPEPSVGGSLMVGALGLATMRRRRTLVAGS